MTSSLGLSRFLFTNKLNGIEGPENLYYDEVKETFSQSFYNKFMCLKMTG